MSKVMPRFIPAAVICLCWLTVHAQSAEITIDRKAIVPGYLERPSPQGMVDDNSPWLHVYVPLLDGTETSTSGKKKKRQRVKWHRRYYFKLSQDKEFEAGVLKSGPKRWSFWNPFRTLKQGTWYWTYGVASSGAPDKPQWSQEVYSFQITGRERMVDPPPSAEELVAIIQKTRGPVTVITQDEIGKLIPDQKWPELASWLRKSLYRALENDGPLDFSVSVDHIPPHMTDLRLYLYHAIKGKWTPAVRHTAGLLRGYLLTGDRKFLDAGIKRVIELEEARKPREFTGKDGKKITIKASEGEHVHELMVDAFYEYIPAKYKKAFLDVILNRISPKGDLRWPTDGPRLHEYLEHVHYDQHDWQEKAQALLMGSMILLRHKPEMEDWVKYAYELWLYRNPAMSRDDGACRNGTGYFGVHDEHLTHTPWVLYKLTGYNYYRHKPWFANFAKHMSYMNPAGNPGQAFSDGGNGGADLQYLGEMLAHMCPDNYWNLWRFKEVGRRDCKHFAADLNKGNKAWDVLRLWAHFPTPDVSHVHPPSELAAEFRDVGLAVMHTDLANPAKNLLVNFRSCPYGSSTHSHPCQNAFNIAYGGQPLFWRSGYYNGGPIHNIFSYKASTAHNTIMPDFNMQGFDMTAYGWLPRFVHGDRISYCLGDASHAYNGVHHYRKSIDELLPKVQGKLNGCTDVGLTRFRRHVVMLRPHHILVYDELAARKPIPWTFRLHCHQEMVLLQNDLALGRNDHAYASVQLLCASPVASAVTDKFYGPATDLENKRDGKNPRMWHLNITTKDRLKATRFLTIFDVKPGKPEGFRPKRLTPDSRGVIHIEGYRITAELDPARESLLKIESTDGKVAFSTGQASTSVKLGNAELIAKRRGSTLLLEKSESKGRIAIERVDELPDVLKYGNIY